MIRSTQGLVASAAALSLVLAGCSSDEDSFEFSGKTADDLRSKEVSEPAEVEEIDGEYELTALHHRGDCGCANCTAA